MSETKSSNHALSLSLYRVVLSVVKIALKFGISAGAMGEMVRRAYIEAAEDLLADEGKVVRVTRVCSLTGLYRKEVLRLKSLPPVETQIDDDPYNRSARVISGWLRDPAFHTGNGKPAVLSLDADDGFAMLVKRYSGDMTPKSILDELLRNNTVSVSTRNTVKLLRRVHIPQSGELDVIQILGRDAPELIETIQHNIQAPPDERLFQRKVMFLHIPERHKAAFTKYAARESQSLLEKLDRWLAKKDTEHFSLGKPGSKMGLGVYLIVSDNKLETED